MKTFSSRSSDWFMLRCSRKLKIQVLERCVFKHRRATVYLVADADRGDQIRQAILDFFDAASGSSPEQIAVGDASSSISLVVRGGANLVAYVGNDGLMDFQLPLVPRQKNDIRRDAIILACISKQYFAGPLRASGANRLLWTTGLMAPEAYTLKAALDGWIAAESPDQIRERGHRLRQVSKMRDEGGPPIICRRLVKHIPHPRHHFRQRPITRILKQCPRKLTKVSWPRSLTTYA